MYRGGELKCLDAFESLAYSSVNYSGMAAYHNWEGIRSRVALMSHFKHFALKVRQDNECKLNSSHTECFYRDSFIHSSTLRELQMDVECFYRDQTALSTCSNSSCVPVKYLQSWHACESTTDCTQGLTALTAGWCVLPSLVTLWDPVCTRSNIVSECLVLYTPPKTACVK